MLANLAVYLHKNFPEDAQAANIAVSCREAACGAVFVYSADLEKIKQQVFESEVLNNLEREATLQNIENAALAAGKGDSNLQLNSLSATFQNLRDVWRSSGDESVKKLAEDVLALIEKTNSAFYQTRTSLCFFEF